MMPISIENCTVQFGEHFSLVQINWILKPDQHWAVCGGNGSGKSALTAILGREGDIQNGVVQGIPDKVAIVSFEEQAKLIEAERKKDDADLLDVIPEGTPVQELLDQTCVDEVIQSQLVEAFNFQNLLDQGVSQAVIRRVSKTDAYTGIVK